MRLPEIREVKDPASPAVAWTENGRTVVEVDQALKGKERSKAIMSAVRLHEEGGLAALVLLPLLLKWGLLKHWGQEHTTAAALAGAGLVAGLALVVAPAVLDGEGRPRAADPPIVRTASSHFFLPTPTTTPTVVESRMTGAPSVLPTSSKVGPVPTRQVEPTATRPNTTRPATRRATRREPTPTPTVEPTPVPSTSGPDKTLAPPSASAASEASPPALDPVADALGDSLAEPSVEVARACLLQVDLDPLANVGVLC